ncbi:MAG: ParB/RepB/Spo0J family partition protein [Oscillospiraceae bacterium]|nr:ParB/RepB/Spo0J family partition protein [Oscillospiraceae bacterium]
MKKNAGVFGKIYSLNVEKINPNRNQPRTHFDPNELEALAESIRLHGVIQPITVRKVLGEYELVAGERRLRASKKAGLKTIPAVIISVDDDSSAELALIENLQRSDLNPFEEALAIRALMSEWGMTQSDAARRLSMSQPALANKLRLLNLSVFERELILDAGLTERHARAILRLPSKDRIKAIEEIKRKKLNVSQTEQLIEGMISKPRRKKPLIFVKDVRLFLNTINKAVGVMHAAGIAAEFNKTQTGEFVEFKIKVPMETATKAVGQ